MNSDIEISADSIARVQELVDSDMFDMITPSYNCWMKQCKNQGAPGIREVNCIEFTAPIIKVSVLETVGEFDESFALGYGVELDWARRMQYNGFRMFCDDKSVFYHHGQQTINTIVH